MSRSSTRIRPRDRLDPTSRSDGFLYICSFRCFTTRESVGRTFRNVNKYRTTCTNTGRAFRIIPFFVLLFRFSTFPRTRFAIAPPLIFYSRSIYADRGFFVTEPAPPHTHKSLARHRVTTRLHVCRTRQRRIERRQFLLTGQTLSFRAYSIYSVTLLGLVFVHYCCSCRIRHLPNERQQWVGDAVPWPLRS